MATGARRRPLLALALLALLGAVAAGGGADHAAGREVVDVVWSWPERRLLAGAVRPELGVLDEELHIEFRANGTDFEVTLRRNRALLSGDLRHQLFYANGSVESFPVGRHCYYAGDVVGDPEGRGGLSSCGGGLVGLISAHGKVLSIDPLGGGSARGEAALHAEAIGGSRPHVARFVDDSELLQRRAHLAEFLRGARADGLPARPAADDGSRGGRRLMETDGSLLSGKKFVEVLVVSDNRRYQNFGAHDGLTRLWEHAISVVNTAAVAYRNPPAEGKIFPYSIELTVVDSVVFPDKDPWQDRVGSTGQGGEVEANTLLSSFSSWAQESFADHKVKAHDNRVLLSGLDFDGTTAGLAFIGTMCRVSDSTNINMCPSGEEGSVAICASVVSHEVGHNFGMRHDGDRNSCDPRTYVMASVSVAATTFSSCSVTHMTDFFSQKYDANGACLENQPTTVQGEAICGNGFVEEGEDCDCGTDDCTGIDACCSAANCTFAEKHYECSGLAGPCCESCMFVGASQHKLCRPKRSECDLSEYCPGGTSDCPFDDYVYHGKRCTNAGGEGRCFEGHCNSLQATCGVDMTHAFDGNWDSTDECARHNDNCGKLVCHKADDADPNMCGQSFELHGKQLQVPEGTPCWLPSGVLTHRQGMCIAGECILPAQFAASPICGNGGIDVGEECDCGYAPDPCCDCASCRLKPEAQCSSLDQCCDGRCRFRPQGYVCRLAASEDCDVAEVCTGASGVCPADLGKRWGTRCEYTAPDGTKSPSVCYAKGCVESLEHQCKVQTAGKRPAAMMSQDGVRPAKDHNCSAPACCVGCVVRRGTYFDDAGNMLVDPVECSGCSREGSFSDYTIGEAVNRVWLTALAHGSPLHEADQVCIYGEAVRLVTSDVGCPDDHYLDESVGLCLRCDTGCRKCRGPTNFDCIGRCMFGIDLRGACVASLKQSTLPNVRPDDRGHVDEDFVEATITVAGAPGKAAWGLAVASLSLCATAPTR